MRAKKRRHWPYFKENAVLLWETFLLILKIWVFIVVSDEEIPHLLVE